jgi:hypothetical protein
MGLRAGLTEITPDVFDQIARGEEPDLPSGERRSIDKAWDDFHVVFKKEGPPLSLAIAGDVLHPESRHTLEDFLGGNHDYYVGFMSPGLVRDIANALTGFALSELTRRCEALDPGQYTCGLGFFGELKAAYTEAAQRGNALVIVIA